MRNKPSNQLYWVSTSDHHEDYFVVASSKLAATRFFEDDVGYDPNESKAEFLDDLPLNQNFEEGYASEELLSDLGYTVICDSLPTIYAKAGRTFVCGCVIQRVLLSEASGKSGVYCIRCAGSLFFKIGKTTDVRRRIKELQTGCPYLLVLDFFISCPESAQLEKQLQGRLSSARTQFEWFELPSTEYSLFRSDVRSLSSSKDNWHILEYLQYTAP